MRLAGNSWDDPETKISSMKEPSFQLSGNIVDVVGKEIFSGKVTVKRGKISRIDRCPVSENQYIVPGLVDAHIHIESSMLIPSEFARLAVVHGTVATVSDPHEIANVLGTEGIRFMIANGKKVPFKFSFGAPSCVPATAFETSGATIDSGEVKELLRMKEIGYLSEMMNYPGVLFNDPEVLKKLEFARKAGKPVDGHAPGLTGADLNTYIMAGISTDHECSTLKEALEKADAGMKILIREGSAARNFDDLCPMIATHPSMVMFCSDDKHPDDLVEGHINRLIIRAISKGYDPVSVIRCCTLNPVRHYHLDVGLLQPGDPADLVVVDNLSSFRVLSVFVNGTAVARDGQSLIPGTGEKPFNHFSALPVTKESFRVPAGTGNISVIRTCEGQLITGDESREPLINQGEVVSDTQNDILKITVVNRYRQAQPAVGFISGFGLKRGAIASCVAHDSHNIVAVGVDDISLARAVNLIIREKGGIAVVDGDREDILPMPFAGIMSGNDGYVVAGQYQDLDRQAKTLGTPLRAPFMTLSFMSLLVIPALKMSDKGLFDSKIFTFRSLFVEKS